MNFDNYLFRASSIGAIMTDGRSKSEPLGETCKAKLIECYVTEKYKREKEIENKYISKGLAAEEDSLTLLSRVDKKVYFKNKERITNDFVCGTPDIIDGDCIVDVKTSWDLFTFFNVKTKEVNKTYYYQLQTYMALTGTSNARLIYCLVNTPEPLINDEKRKLMWKMGAVSDQTPDYLEACDEMDRAMRFDDIPMQDRIIEFKINRDNDVIENIYKRIVICRYFLNEFAK